jgi:integrase
VEGKLKVMRQKLVILPKLNHCGGDPAKQWFVYYSCRNPKSGKMVRFRVYDGFTDLSPKEKYQHAKQLIDLYSERLKAGWSPFTDTSEALYTDHIDYKTVADLYGNKRAGNNTLRPAISAFLEELQPGVSVATFQTYQSKFRIFALWIEKQGLAGNDLATINNSTIKDFFWFLIRIRKLSGNSITKYRRNLNALFDYLYKRKIILINPVYDIPICDRINDQAPRPISRDDIDRFRKELIKDPELWLAVQFEYYCALRPGHELREMKIKDLDLVAGTVRVSRSRAKNRHERVVTIPSQLLEQLRGFYHLQKYGKELYVFGKGGCPGHQPIGKNKLRYKFNAIRKRLGMPYEYKFYSWKHTGAIEADEANIPTKDISRHLGHESLKSTDAYFRNKKPGISRAIRDNYPSL